MTTNISKETIKRLLNDIKHLIDSPLVENGIYYIHDETDILKGYALIIGPENTPYFGGSYFFEFHFPCDYPHSPPKVIYCTNGENIRFGPNLYKCGKVCLSLLNTWRGEQWTSCQTISSVLLNLCMLLCDNPLLNEPGVTIKHHDLNNYNEIIEFANFNVAICDIVNKKPGIYMEFFDYFYTYIKEHFIKNYDKLIAFVENKIKHSTEEYKILKTSYYSMIVKINYFELVEKLKLCKTNIDKMKL
jgi:ubiquitin-conjugating enzyme E2 Z